MSETILIVDDEHRQPGEAYPVAASAREWFIAPTIHELERHVAELTLLAEASGSEGGKAQEMRVPAARHPLLDTRPV
jgi:hypothetical protein